MSDHRKPENSKEVICDEQVISELLNRDSPPGYVEEWTELIKQGKGDTLDEALQSVLIFRSKNQWLALSVKVIKDIIPMRTVHSIPHRMNDILKGTVNVGGHLKLYISLTNILEITSDDDTAESNGETGFMCLISLDHNDWVIRVDEIFGIRRFAVSSLENVPVTVSKSTANYFKGIFRLDGKDIGYIEEELLFYSLKRRACD